MAHFQAVDLRAVFVVAVGNQQLYRPHESPANDHIIDDAGDAVGSLRRLSSTFSLYRDLTTNQDPSKPS
jgi:hypothetical protein